MYHEVREKTSELYNLQKKNGTEAEEIPGVSKLISLGDHNDELLNMKNKLAI